MNTHKLLVTLVALNIVMALCQGLYATDGQLFDSVLTEELGYIDSVQDSASSEQAQRSIIRRVADTVTESSAFDMLRMSLAIGGVFLRGMLPIPNFANATSPLDRTVMIFINLFQAITQIIAITQLYMIVKNKATD